MNAKRKDTRTDLVEELKKLKQHPEIVFMIQEAQAGEYHDYKNKKYICGKTEAVNKLYLISKFFQDPSFLPLANRIADGEFDEEADEDDKKMMREAILKDSSSQQEAEHMIKALGL
jgi:hypothetical protein